jgi:dipeptide/tripeptide permease
LKVAELWSEITQDNFIRIKNGFVLKKEKMLTSIRTLLDVLFFWQLKEQPGMELSSYQKLN